MKTKKNINNPIARNSILALTLGATLGLCSPAVHAKPKSLDILTTNKAPIAPDGTTAGATTDFVITFKDPDPGTKGEKLHAGATIEVVLGDAFNNTENGEVNTTIILQGWPQSPPTPPFPWTTDIIGNTITLTLTDDFKPGDFGPGAKQVHLILRDFTNPALPGVYPVELTIKPNSGNSRKKGNPYRRLNFSGKKVFSGIGHVRIIPDARPSVNPASLFSGPAGPPPPFFNPIYQTLELGEPARRLGLYLWDYASEPFLGVDVSATDNPSYYHLTQGATVVGEVWITAPVGASTYSFGSVPLPPGGPPSFSVVAFGTGVPVGLLGVQFTPDPAVAGDYEIAIDMIGGNETTLFVTVED